MRVKPGDPMPPLSAFPKETQEVVMQILLKCAKRKLEHDRNTLRKQ